MLYKSEPLWGRSNPSNGTGQSVEKGGGSVVGIARGRHRTPLFIEEISRHPKAGQIRLAAVVDLHGGAEGLAFKSDRLLDLDFYADAKGVLGMGHEG